MIMTVILVALALVQPGFAQEKDAKYFCIEETIAGLKFNEGTEMWEAKTVRPEHKFVIRRKFVKLIVPYKCLITTLR